MAHIALATTETMSKDVVKKLSELETKGKKIGEIVRLLALHEEVFFATDNMGKKYLLEETLLSFKTKERIAILVSIENGCKMCVNVHKELAKALGMSDTEIEEISLGIDSLSCSDNEKTLLRFAVRASQKDNYKILKNDIYNVKKLGYSDKEIIEAVAIAGYFNYMNTLSNVFGLGLDE